MEWPHGGSLTLFIIAIAIVIDCQHYGITIIKFGIYNLVV